MKKLMYILTIFLLSCSSIFAQEYLEDCNGNLHLNLEYIPSRTTIDSVSFIIEQSDSSVISEICNGKHDWYKSGLWEENGDYWYNQICGKCFLKQTIHMVRHITVFQDSTEYEKNDKKFKDKKDKEK